MVRGLIALFLLPLALFATTPASAAHPLDEARTQGLIGERADGYVAVVTSGASQEVKALVEHVNAERLARFTKIAQKNGIPVEAVAARAGAKLVAERPAGEWVADASGNWRQK